MYIIAKTGLDTIELNGKVLTIKGFSTFFLKKVYSTDVHTIVIKKFKPAGKIFSGKLILEVWGKRKKQFIFNFQNKQQVSFDSIVEIIQNGYAENGLILCAIGVDGLIELYENRIKIKRDPNSRVGFYLHGLKGDKEISIKQISAVQFKKPGTVTRGILIKGLTHNGYIQFSFPGSNESKKGLMAAVGDENTVFFNKENTLNFEKLKNLIIEKINQQYTNVLNSRTDIIDHNADLNAIEKLAELKEKGIITEEEFIKKKKDILKL